MKLVLSCLVFCIAFTGCTHKKPAPVELPPVVVAPIEPPKPELGTWVMGEADFGPCLPAPTGQCEVGRTISAKAGPGEFGGCAVWTCVK